MYLYKRTYVKNWDHMRPEELHSITVKKAGKKVKSINPKKIAYIIEDAGYWRKANAIHKWMVENVQDGQDDCKEYHFGEEQMEKLLDACEQVVKFSKLVKGKIQNGTRYTKEKGEEPTIEDGKIIKDPSVAIALLPTNSGFFFGSTEYNEWYLKDIKNTVKILKEALANEEGEYYYSSSW